MKINFLNLSNFKGVPDFRLDLKGRSAVIRGPNGAGKTTVFDAYSWLVTDKDSTGAAKFAIKPAEMKKGAVPMVSGSFDNGGEKPVAMRKEYAEKWTKPRGKREHVFGGHETNYYFGEVPVAKGVFIKAATEVAPPETFALLSNPLYFNRLPMRTRRETLFEMAGDIPEPRGKGFAEIRRDIDDCPDVSGENKASMFKSVLMKQRREINDELERVPVRIDELQRQTFDALSPDERKTLELEKRAIEGGIEALEKRLAKSSDDDEIAAKKARLRAIIEKSMDVELKLKTTLVNIRKDRDGCDVSQDKEGFGTLRRVQVHENEVDALNDEIRLYEEKLAALRKKFETVSAEEMPPITALTTCPTCGQDIPEALALDREAAARAGFNAKQAVKLDEIDKEGQRLSKFLKAKKESKAAHEAEAAKARVALQETEAENKKRMETFDVIIKDAEAAAADEIKILNGQAAEVEREISDLEVGNRDAVDGEIKAELETERKALSAVSERLALAKAAEDIQARIDGLLLEEKRLAAEVDAIEEKLATLEDYIRARCEKVSEAVNKLFKRTKWRLFEPQVNGGLMEVCDPVWTSGATWADMSHSEKVYCGIDCIDALSTYYGQSMPIFVDDAEGVLNKIDIDAQLIRLCAVYTDGGKLEVELL